MGAGYQLMILGARYERAYRRQDFARRAAIEEEIYTIERANPEVWATSWVVRGRNFICEHNAYAERYAP